MSTRSDWEEITRLGGGGQSDVYLVRKPERRMQRQRNLEMIRVALDGDKRAELATSIWSYARPDNSSELAALKMFKTRGEEEADAIKRLTNEIAMLEKGRSGLPKLFDSNLSERWLVTEYFAAGTLQDNPTMYRGRPGHALRAFRSLVKTVAAIHEEGFVHRDIKPANIFVGDDGELVLGDFGVVFIPNEAERLTATQERVGPRDYMPQWGDLGERLEQVDPSFDIYMLGKLLWCMVSGRLKLPREYFKRQGFNLVEMFPYEPAMHMINTLLSHCVVEEQSNCTETARELLIRIDGMLAVLTRGGQLLTEGVVRPCRVCGEGEYLPQQDQLAGLTLSDMVSRPIGAIRAEIYLCSNCGHVELFKTKKRVP